MNDKIRRVRCDVESCVHNSGAKECTADKIDVTQTCDKPDCCDETQCKTFKPNC